MKLTSCSYLVSVTSRHSFKGTSSLTTRAIRWLDNCDSDYSKHRCNSSSVCRLGKPDLSRAWQLPCNLAVAARMAHFSSRIHHGSDYPCSCMGNGPRSNPAERAKPNAHRHCWPGDIRRTRRKSGSIEQRYPAVHLLGTGALGHRNRLCNILLDLHQAPKRILKPFS